MAFYDTTWYVNSVGYATVTARPQNTAVAAGVVRRQFTAPAVGSERVFVCIVAGTTANVTDATWVLTRGAKTTDGTATWQECTGASAVNGDLTNTVNWTAAKAAGAPTLGAIIKRNNGASYQICTTAGAMGASEPSFSDTAGTTTTDSSAVWTSLGVVGNFTGGGAPHARLASACASTWFVTSNTIFVGDNHAESQGANIAIAPSGTASSLISKIICHNHSGSYPPAAGDITTGATISTTTTFTITITATSTYFYGIAFKGGVGGSTGSGPFVTLTTGAFVNQAWGFFDSCSFQVANTSTSGGYVQLSGGSTFALNNCTVGFGHVNGYINAQLNGLVWQNTGQVLAAGSAVPAILFNTTASASTSMVLEALDLSQLTGALFSDTNSSFPHLGSLTIKDCKLNASATVVSPIHTGMIVQLVRCDSGATNYKSSRYTYEGTETTEASITRVGGATDGVTATSDKIVTTANAQWLRPFIAMPLTIWNETTGANVTMTVYGTINSGTLPNNDEIMMEVEYLGSSASPLGTIKTTTKASALATNAAVASDGSTWNGGGSGAGWSPFKLVATLTSPQPQMKGFIYATVRAGKASTTYYIDPLPTLS